MTTIRCPECGLTAEIERRFALASTEGPVEHVKTRCAAGHVLTLPADQLRSREPAPAALAR